MRTRGQSSIEFLFVTAAGLLLVVVVAFSFLSASRSAEDRARLTQVNNIGNSIVEQASTVYALGANSWVNIDVNMPQSVVAVYTAENRAIVFDVQTSTGIVSLPVFSPTPLVGAAPAVGVRNDINTTIGTAHIQIHSGNTPIRVTSQGSVVLVQAIG